MIRDKLRAAIWLLSAITVFLNGTVLLSTVLIGGGSITIGHVALNSHDPRQRPFIL
jgi:hypothetical protein